MEGDYYQPNARGAIPTPRQIQKHKAPPLQATTNNDLSQTINHAHEVLIKAKTVFPFTLFPDTVILDREKFTIIHREFFMTGEVVSTPIKDILNVTADVGPFFGSIKVLTRFFNSEKPYEVKFLPRRDALRLKRVLQGFVIAQQKDIDTAMLTIPQLTQMLEQLGN